MSTRPRELIGRLHGQDIHPTGEELADVLWLALRMGELEEAAKTAPPGAGREAGPDTRPPADGSPAPSPGTAKPDASPQPEGSVPFYADAAATPTVQDGKTAAGARPFRTPAAAALSDALALSRALRPLMRKIPSRSRQVLDETATAEHYAERSLFVPSFRGQPERWLELALVVDSSPSMRLWYPTLADLYRLLAGHGAFRDVRLWHLGTDSDGRPFLSKRSDGGQRRRPEELLDPEGRRLVLLVSDCAAPAWYDPKTFDGWLRLWGRHQCVALLHLLPPRFWLRGGLARAHSLTRVRASWPGQPNRRLIAATADLPADPLLLPLFTLEPESVALWADLLAGRGENRSLGVILDRVTKAEPPSPTRGVSAQQRVREFRRSASPEAQTLARYCAALPLTLPVMRLLQSELLPQSHQVHLAEVFFSGLLRRVNPQETDPRLFLYDFRKRPGNPSTKRGWKRVKMMSSNNEGGHYGTKATQPLQAAQ